MKLHFGQTALGWPYITFEDRYAVACSIQKSSLATEDCIWLGVNDADPKILAREAAAHGVETDQNVGWVAFPVPDAVSMTTRMHLNQEQVRALLPILQEFAESGELPIPVPSAPARTEKAEDQAHMNHAIEEAMREEINTKLMERFGGKKLVPDHYDITKTPDCVTVAMVKEALMEIISDMCPPAMPEVEVELAPEAGGISVHMTFPRAPRNIEIKV